MLYTIPTEGDLARD